MKRLVVLLAVVAAAVLAPQAFSAAAVSVTPTGNGSGTVVGDGSVQFPSGLISCTYSNGVVAGTCARAGLSAQVIRVAASPSAGSTFGGWLGGCPGVLSAGGAICTFSINGVASEPPISLIPQFNSVRRLTVVKQGTGSGTVTGSPGGINCGSVCSVTYSAATVVTLTATPASGSTFAGWGGACAGSGTNSVCILPFVQASATVTATFNPRPLFTLTVSTAGNGSGTVTSSPAGITCPSTCAASVVGGTTVTLTATPAAGSAFQGFSGACTGTSCTVPVNAAASVTATFTLTAVQASVVGTRITKTGPVGFKRVLKTTVDADEGVTVTLRIVRNGNTIAAKSATISAGERTINFPLRNGIAPGRAQLQVTLENDFGVTKNQNRRINIPPV